MKIKKKVGLLDKELFEVLASWSSMQRGKVKYSAAILSSALDKIIKVQDGKNVMKLDSINKPNPVEVPVTIARDDNNISISCMGKRTTAYINIWEHRNPIWHDSFKNIIMNRAVKTNLYNLKHKGLNSISSSHNLFYDLLVYYLIALESEGYILIDISTSKDYGYIYGDTVCGDIRLGFRMHHRVKNINIMVDFNLEEQTYLVE